MKFLDAYWEKRNLGVNTCEITIEKEDTNQELVFGIKQAEQYDYSVIRLPQTRWDFLFQIQKSGYSYIEDMITFRNKIDDIHENPAFLNRYNKSIHIENMDEDDIQFLLSDLKKGIFTLDRVSIDPYFSQQLATNRYVHWVMDLIEQGALFFNYYLGNRRVAFVVLKKNNDFQYDSVLGGKYSDYLHLPLGAIEKTPEIVYQLGGNEVITRVSSNDIAQLKVMIANGFMLSNINYIFVKHANK